MLSFILSVSMLIVSVMNFWAFGAADFDNVSVEKLKRQTASEDGYCLFHTKLIPPLPPMF